MNSPRSITPEQSEMWTETPAQAPPMHTPAQTHKYTPSFVKDIPEKNVDAIPLMSESIAANSETAGTWTYLN